LSGEPASMIAGALIAFGPAILGIVSLERWRRRISRRYADAEVRSLRRREAWQAVAEYDLRRAA
jgi:hypothetical protein